MRNWRCMHKPSNQTNRISNIWENVRQINQCPNQALVISLYQLIYPLDLHSVYDFALSGYLRPCNQAFLFLLRDQGYISTGICIYHAWAFLLRYLENISSPRCFISNSLLNVLSILFFLLVRIMTCYYYIINIDNKSSNLTLR